MMYECGRCDLWTAEGPAVSHSYANGDTFNPRALYWEKKTNLRVILIKRYHKPLPNAPSDKKL